MRAMRMAVLAGLAFKAVVLGLWWWGSIAHAERAAKPEQAGATAEAVVPPDLLARSRGFRDLLEAVRQRGLELDQREQALQARAATLDALEKTVSAELARLEGATGCAKSAPVEGASPPPVPGGPVVTKIYENMKAEEAAPILDRLDDATARTILARMKEKQIGAILAAMNRDRAVALTKALAAGPSS